MPRRLIVTAGELTMPGGNGNQLTPWEFTLSFAIVDAVEVMTISYDPHGPFGRDRIVDGAVVITEQRGVCKTACVFMFVGDNGVPDLVAANRFADIVRAGHSSVDPFGRSDGPRQVAVLAGARAPRPVWHKDLHEQGREVRAAAGEVENAVFGYAKSALRREFSRCLSDALNTASAAAPGSLAWSYVPVTNLSVNREAELDVGSVMKSAELKTLGSNSLLVSDVFGIGFTYLPPLGTDPARVESTFRAFVDFFDLEPVKDGRYFWFDFSRQRTMAELVADPVAAIRRDIEDLCRALSVRIREEIASHPPAGRDESS